MLARKMAQMETKWERAENRFKTYTYTLLHELLQAQIKSPIIYKLLLFIETVQFFWYAIHPNFSFLWTVDVANWLRTGVKYFQLDAVLNTGNKNVFIVALYLVFTVQVFMILLGIVTALQLTRSKKKSSTIVTYSLKVLSAMNILMSTVFSIPIFNIYLSSIICFDKDKIHTNVQCYQGIYFLHLATGILGLIISLIWFLMLTALYIDLNPWSTLPFAAPRSKLPLLRLLLKLVVIIYIILDYNRNLTKEFIAIYGVIWIGMIILRYRQTPHYNRSVFRMVLAMDSIMLWACIVACTHAFIDNPPVDSLGLFFLFFGYPFFAYAAITIIERRQSAFRRLVVKNLKKDDNVEMYINVVFNLIENRDKPQPRIALEGLLKYHIKHCQKKENECACWPLSRDFGKDEEPPEKLWYTWIKHIIIDLLENFPKSTRLHMLYAYIQREKLHNKFKALFEMMITEENKPNMEEEFSIFSYKNVIEEEMIENDARNSESKGVDVNVIVDFQNKFVDFQAAVENAVDLHLEFWRELLENNPDIQKLQSLGSKITHSLEETSAEFIKLNDINPNHIKMLQIYGNYLKDIVNDEVEGQRTLEKAEYVDKSAAVNKQFVDNDHLKYGENSNTCIFTVSGNLSSIGTIKNVNNEITRILGFSKPDLIGQNISRIIPKIIGDLHDGFMKNYFETSDSKVIGVERVVFPLNKEGYVVPCSLMIKVLPNLDEGIRLVGFLKDLDKEGAFAKGSDMEMEEKVHYIMYSGETLAIHGITYSCKKGFGIPASLVSGNGANNDFTMDIIFPELLSHPVEDLKNTAGVVTTLDTSSLQQNYLFGDSRSDGSEYGEEEEEEEEEKEKKFRKAQVRVVLAEDVDYQDTNIRVLKFVEVYEEGDLKRELSVTKNDMEVKENAKDIVGKTEDESKVEPGEGRSAEYNGGSEKDSSISGGEGMNEDIKQLKDFKALISEKTVPKSIRLLSRTVIILLLLLIVLAILVLNFRLKQATEFTTAVGDITQAYERTNLMADINFKTRQLQVLASGWRTIQSGETSTSVEYGYKNALITLIDNLSTVQFNIMRSAEVLQNDGVNTMDSQNILLEHQVEGSITLDYRIYTDSVFQYITAASSVRNSTISLIITTSSTDSTPKNFYLVRRNGLGTLREGSESESTIFYNYYVHTADKYNNTFRALMIIAICLLVVSDCILIPIVFSVHRTNNRVLAFFGYIPLTEIEQLADKCEKYMEKYIDDHKEVHNFSYEDNEGGELDRSQRSNNVDESYVEGSQNPEESVVDGDSINPETSMQMDVSERIEVSPVNDFTKAPRQMTLNVPASSTRKNNVTTTGGKGGNVLPNENSMMKSKGQDLMISSQENSKIPLNKTRDFVRDDAKKVTTKEEDRKKKEEAEILDLEQANDRIQKLLNSRNNKRSNVVVQFLIVAIIFGIYFLLDYVLVELPFLTNIKAILEHLKFTSQRMPYIRYLNAFTLEEIAELNLTNVYYYPNQGYTNYRKSYSSLIQMNEQDITNPALMNFPSQFNDYLSLFSSYNDQDLCASYYASLNRQAECESVSQSLLSRGLSLSVTTILLNSDAIINSFDTAVASIDITDKVATGAAKRAAINGAAFNQSRQIQKYIMPALEHLQSQYEVAYLNYLTNVKKIEAIKFVMFLLFCFLVFFALWQPYLKNLNDNIFRTKGMLSMIPMDIISKNENLRTLFLTGNILQAVK